VGLTILPLKKKIVEKPPRKKKRRKPRPKLVCGAKERVLLKHIIVEQFLPYAL
jgi:hypothetical protein